MAVFGCVFLSVAAGFLVWYLRRNTPLEIEKRREFEFNSSRSGRWYVHDSGVPSYLGKFFKFKDVTHVKIESKHLAWSMSGYVIEIDEEDEEAYVKDFDFENYVESCMLELKARYREANPDEFPKLEKMLEMGLGRKRIRDEIRKRKTEKLEKAHQQKTQAVERLRAREVKNLLDKY